MEINEYQIDALISSVSPVFTGEARTRLRLMRMMLKLDQAQLAKLLGVGPRTITNVENGARVSRNPIMMDKFISVFGIKGVVYIISGKYAAGMAEMAPKVHDDYWKSKHAAKGNRTPPRERNRYRDKTKSELLKENLELREVIHSGSFKNSKIEGED